MAYSAPGRETNSSELCDQGKYAYAMCMHLHTYECEFTRTYMYACVRRCVHDMYVRVSMSVYTYRCIDAWIYIYICRSMYMCAQHKSATAYSNLGPKWTRWPPIPTAPRATIAEPNASAGCHLTEKGWGAGPNSLQDGFGGMLTYHHTHRIPGWDDSTPQRVHPGRSRTLAS